MSIARLAAVVEMLALGRARQVKSRKYFDADVTLPAFLQAKNLKPFISNDLEVTSSRIDFRTLAGAKAFGFTAEVLPSICEVFIEAERAGKLNETQNHIADRARVLYRGFAKLGIIALVDEATGYQEIRARDALQAYLEKFIRAELAAWVKTFPDEFFRELYRLKKWPWSGSSRRREHAQEAARRARAVEFERLAREDRPTPQGFYTDRDAS